MNMPSYSVSQIPQEEETIDLVHYWRVLMNNKFSILAPGFVLAAAAAYMMVGAEDIYRSTATMLVESDQANITSIQDVYGSGVQTTEDLNTQFEMLKNRTLAEQVIRRLGLHENPQFLPEEKESNVVMQTIENLVQSLKPEKSGSTSFDPEFEEYKLMDPVIDFFKDNLSISPITNTNLVKVSFESRNPLLATEIVNTLAEVYIENDIKSRLDASRDANEWLSERLQRLKVTLDASEQKLQGFLAREQLIDIEGIASLNIQEINQLSQQSLLTKRTRAEAETLYRQVQDLKTRNMSDILSFPAILNHSSMTVARQEASRLDRSIAELKNRYGRNHPRMISAVAEKASAQKTLEDQALQVIESIESDYESATFNERIAVDQLETSKGDLQTVNLKNFELGELQREVETNQQLYDIFFTRIRETDETSDFETANALITDPGVRPLDPSGPNRKLVVIVAMALGLMLGAFVALMRDFLDNSLKNHTDVEERLKTSALGIIPLVEQNRKDKDNELAFLGFVEDPHSKFSESLRTIRTSITLSSLDKPYKIIEVTSTVPNEGKSTVSINLASVMGQMSKVLLIDADMRRPSLAKSLDLGENAKGLSNFMAGNAKIKDCIYHKKEANFYVLPAGDQVPNPLEMLASKRFRNLLSQLGTKFNTIILDTPPMQAVSDSLILSTIADAVVYVAKADSTPANHAKGELDRLKEVKANVVGVVLNQVDIKKLSAYNYGGYYDNYGYSSPK